MGQPQAYSPKLIEHLTSSSLVIVKEAQQAADIKTAFATSLLPAESLLVYQGDDRQSPGGSEDMNEVRALRKVLLNTPIGLRAHNEYYQPWKLPRLFSQLIATAKEVTAVDLKLHCYEIADPTKPFNPYRQGGNSRAVNSITNWIEPHLPLPADAKELLNLHHPLGFLVGIMLTLASPNHGLFLHTVQTNMEAAGLEGLHRWGITLPSSARVMRSTNLQLPFSIRIFVNATWAVGQSVSLCCPLSRAHHLVPATYSCHNQWNGNSAEARKLLTKSLSKHTETSMPLSSTNYPSSTLVLTRWKASSLCAIALKSSGF